MDYNTVRETVEGYAVPQDVSARSVYDAFQQVSDGRKKRGVRYSVPLILTLILLGKLAGMKDISAIAHWVRLRAEQLSQELPVERKQFPCGATYGNVLRTVDAQQVIEVIAQLVTRRTNVERCGEEPSRLLGQAGRQETAHVALDGKTMRGTLKHEQPNQSPVHLLSLYESKTGLVLAQRQVHEKENEISAAPALLIPLYIKGRILTADAMHTQRKHCATITRYDGDYVLIAKKNQPQLYEDLQLFFEDPEADQTSWHTYTKTEKGHGRLETRSITTSTDLNEFFARDWAGIAQVFRLERTVRKKGQTHHEVVYGFTSLSPRQASPARLLELVRAHWAIENRLHWRRDVTLGEDHSQVRTGNAPQVLAALNNGVLALMDWLGVRNVPAQMRFFDAHPLEALRVLLR